jgi:hypothetical protein
MTTEYLCKRCGIFKTKHFNDLKKHIDRKNSCKKTNEVMFLSDDQLLAMSLLPNNVLLCILEKDTHHLKNSNILTKNKKKIFEEFNSIEKLNDLICCKYCNSEFSLIQQLKKHLILNCYYNELIKNENLENNNININEIKIDNSINNNINGNNNIININNIKVEIKNPIPFDNEWDLSKINEHTKQNISFSQYMYTSLLEEILKNEINLNVVIDVENDSGMVYKNNIDKYIEMKSKDIVEKTMEKLCIHLHNIHENNNIAFKEIIEFGRRMAKKKYIDYQNSESIQRRVKKNIFGLYKNKKKEAIEIARYTMENTENDDDTKY